MAGQVTKAVKASPYRITRASLVWIIAAVLLIPYEILCVIRGVDGGPLTHVVKVVYGDPGSVRWWILGHANWGFLLWLGPHFQYEGWGIVSLLAFVAAGALLGLAMASLTGAL